MGSSVFSGIDLAVSGMMAERKRMQVISSNIANANTVGNDGQPYRRRSVEFREVLGGALDQEGEKGGIPQPSGGVMVQDVITDTKTEHPTVYQPGHPAADKDGFVTLPNVNVMYEMVDLMIARRAYSSNIAAFKSYRSMLRQAIQQIGAR